jgi:hypothetical protein
VNARLLVAAALLALLSGCEATKDDAPDPTPGNIVNGTNTHVIKMPDGFRNVAFTCFDATGVYVTSRGPFGVGNSDATTLPSSVFVLANDPHCGGAK